MKPELNPHSATRAASRAGTGHPASRARAEPAHRAAGVRERSRTLAREPAAPVTVRHHRGRACAQVTAALIGAVSWTGGSKAAQERTLCVLRNRPEALWYRFEAGMPRVASLDSAPIGSRFRSSPARCSAVAFQTGTG